MSDTFVAFAMLLAGGLLGYSLRAVLFILKKNSLELSVSERLMHAREQAQEILDEAHDKAELVRHDLKAAEDRLIKKESLLDERQQELDDKSTILEYTSAQLLESEQDVATRIAQTTSLLESIAGCSIEEAYADLLKQAERAFAQDLQTRIHKLDHSLNETITDHAKDILMTTIQRLAVPTVTELSTANVSLESDDQKGKIIGKEGRNIRVFERLSGVELLVDETPGTIVVSCFDPVRRTIAVHALEALINDGRIHPAKIEEEIEKSKHAIHDIIKEKGAAAVYDCGIYNLDPRVVAILGRLHFRTSYGQNVLAHSIEMAHIAEMLASEIGADPYISKAGALVHDIGKALDHEFEGTHVDIGIKVLRRFETDERIISAMKSHHDDVPHETLEAAIVQTADMISGARPGARRDSAELYLKRLGELESLAARFPGVEKVFAIQAGREIRVFVHPEDVSDMESRTLARTIARSIETELRYPGQIKVTIIRETRITDYAR